MLVLTWFRAGRDDNTREATSADLDCEHFCLELAIGAEACWEAIEQIKGAQRLATGGQERDLNRSTGR